MNEIATVKIRDIALYRVLIPLKQAYPTALGTFTELDTIVSEIHGADDRCGVGDTTIIPRYTNETVEGGWRICQELAAAVIGKTSDDALRIMEPFRLTDPHAVSVLQVAIEMAGGHPLLAPPPGPRRVPILAPVNSKSESELPVEIERLVAEGFRTLKVKVGWNVDADLRRVALIQEITGGRAVLRLDANQGFDRSSATRFASSLNPAGIELFEQPCDAVDWDGNAAVAAASAVPLMLDESIYSTSDIDRAARIPGCKFVKLKISKMTGVALLHEGLQRIRRLGMEPVLGNGAASDIGCWVEACVGAVATHRAGEMHGFLKNRSRLFSRPLAFDKGDIVLEPDFAPALNHGTVNDLATAKALFG